MAEAIRMKTLRAAGPARGRKPRPKALKKWESLSEQEKDSIMKQLAIKMKLVAED